MKRRVWLAAFFLGPALSWAQAFPSKPIRIMVGANAGGGTDIVARMLAEKMAEGLFTDFGKLTEKQTAAVRKIMVDRQTRSALKQANPTGSKLDRSSTARHQMCRSRCRNRSTDL